MKGIRAGDGPLRCALFTVCKIFFTFTKPGFPCGEQIPPSASSHEPKCSSQEKAGLRDVPRAIRSSPEALNPASSTGR